MGVDTHSKNREEFLRIYDAMKKKVFLTAMRYSDNNYTLSQDVSQEVFEKLYTHFDSINREYLPGWLITTTKNTMINHVKRAGREFLDEDIIATADLRMSAKSAEDEAEQEWEEADTKKAADTILDKLYQVNERWYTAMTLVYCMNKKQHEVAHEMGISVEVLNSVLYRARKWVRKNYKPEDEV